MERGNAALREVVKGEWSVGLNAATWKYLDMTGVVPVWRESGCRRTALILNYAGRQVHIAWGCKTLETLACQPVLSTGLRLHGLDRPARLHENHCSSSCWRMLRTRIHGINLVCRV